MTTLVTEDMRAKATIYHGKEIKEQTQKLLRKFGFPTGLLPVDDGAEELGYVEETGFLWIKQKKKTEHKFEKVGSSVSYGTLVTASAEPTKIKSLTGVKASQLLMWVRLAEMTVPHMNADKVTFKTMSGITKTYPADAFMAEEADSDAAAKDAEEVKKAAEVVTPESTATQAMEV